jgi:hypothetical protein
LTEEATGTLRGMTQIHANRAFALMGSPLIKS